MSLDVVRTPLGLLKILLTVRNNFKKIYVKNIPLLWVFHKKVLTRIVVLKKLGKSFEWMAVGYFSRESAIVSIPSLQNLPQKYRFKLKGKSKVGNYVLIDEFSFD